MNPAHLFLGTPGDNTRDASSKWRMPYGIRHAHAKLVDAVVTEARMRYRGGEEIASLARLYGVAETTMATAISGKTWRHVK